MYCWNLLSNERSKHTIVTTNFTVVNTYTHTSEVYIFHTLGYSGWVRWRFLPAEIPRTPRCTPGTNTTRSEVESSRRWTKCNDMWKSYYSKEKPPFRGERRPTKLAQLCPDRLGCTLEFGREVVLIYWPPAAPRSRDICDNGQNGSITSNPLLFTHPPQTITTTAITFKGEDLGFLEAVSTYWGNSWEYSGVKSSVLYGDFTFVSPTVYLAHHTFTAAKHYWVGEDTEQILRSANATRETAIELQIRTAGVIALHSSDVYSWQPRQLDSGVYFSQLIAKGQFRHSFKNPSDRPGQTVPFNFDDLQIPIPASVYYNAREDCWGNQSHCGTITEGAYRPRIAIKNSVWLSMLPKWYSCDRPLLNDPPIRLQRVTGIVHPTIHPATTPAAEGGNFPLPVVAEPGMAVPNGPKQTLASDSGGVAQSSEDAQKGLTTPWQKRLGLGWPLSWWWPETWWQEGWRLGCRVRGAHWERCWW